MPCEPRYRLGDHYEGATGGGRLPRRRITSTTWRAADSWRSTKSRIGSAMRMPAFSMWGSPTSRYRRSLSGAPGPPGAAEDGTGGIVTAGTTKLPAARSPGAVEGGSAILAARTFGLRATRPPRALEGAGVTVAAGTELPAARPPGAIEGGGGGTTAASNVGSAGAGGGGGVDRERGG